MKPQNVILTCTAIAVVGLAARRFAGFDGKLAAEGAKALGVVEADTDADSPVPINVLGVMLVESGGPVTLGAEVQTDANGRAIPKAAGIGNGFAVDAAIEAGELIRIARGI